MIFHTQSRERKKIHLTVDNNVIGHVAVFDFLGIAMDEKITWNSHIKYLAKFLE